MKNQIITFIQVLCSQSFYCVSFVWLGDGDLFPVVFLMLLMVAWYMLLLVDRYATVGG